MKKIWNWIVNIPQDKLLHIMLISVTVAVTILLLKAFGFSNIASCCYGWGVGFALGIGKEIYDEIKKGSSEAADWAADIIANTAVCIYSYILLIL